MPQLYLPLTDHPTFADLCAKLCMKDAGYWPDDFGRRLRNYMVARLGNPIRTVSLFSGAGGLDIGFHDAGFDVLQMVEMDGRYATTLRKNTEPKGYFGHGHVSEVDIRLLFRGEKLAVKGRIDFIIGGPPCQTFSAAGRRAAGVQGTHEPRGTLFQEYVRILDCLQPRAFLFENVYGITGADSGKAWKSIQEAFASAGYTIHHRVLDAADYGVPQHRERLFIVGTRNADFRFPRPTHGPDSIDQNHFYTPIQALQGLPLRLADPRLEVNGRYGKLLPEIPPGLNYSFFTEKMGHPRPLFAWRSKFSDFLYKADRDIPVRTIKAFCGQYTGPFHWENRRFSLDELKRLQTFPDAYPIEGARGAVLQQIGNSVPPQMARMLAISVINQLFAKEELLPIGYFESNEELSFRKRRHRLAQFYKTRASAAIESRRLPVRVLKAKTQEFSASVDAKFGFSLREHATSHSVTARFDPPSCLSIRTTGDRRRSKPAFSITIEAAEGLVWSLPFERIEVHGTQLAREDFLVGWKAVEHWLSAHNLKADLVQLYGYYAYEALAVNRCDLHGATDWRWTRLAELIGGSGTRAIYKASELCNIFRLSESSLRQWLSFLRSLGYEVRSHNTNPQIAPNSYLLPYSVPTLTAESVQRTKDLFESDRLT